MGHPTSLGDFEQIVLLAILRLGDDAYGVSIRAEIAVRTGREVAPGALYTALDRLEEKKFVKSRMGDPTPQRGGRSKRYYLVTAIGQQALVQTQDAYRRLLDGLELFGGANA